MLTRRTLLLSLGALAAIADSAAAQPAGPTTRPVFQHDLPDINLSNWSATAVEVSYGPGESSPPHRHPGITLAYVLEGAIRSRVADEPEQTFRAGQMFIETPEQLHAVSRNASSTEPAKLLAILLTRKGATLTTPATP
jgi:quercetin dioxygenase-like cupin family protein